MEKLSPEEIVEGAHSVVKDSVRTYVSLFASQVIFELLC